MCANCVRHLTPNGLWDSQAGRATFEEEIILSSQLRWSWEFLQRLERLALYLRYCVSTYSA